MVRLGACLPRSDDAAYRGRQDERQRQARDQACQRVRSDLTQMVRLIEGDERRRIQYSCGIPWSYKRSTAVFRFNAVKRGLTPRVSIKKSIELRISSPNS